MNRYGTAVKNSGLLLYKGGTVCDDGFDKNSANAICNLMGYASYGSEWSTGRKWTIQDNYRIKLDDINCRSTSWSTCTYSESYYNNCYHSEDVFLTCESSDRTGILLIFSENFNLRPSRSNQHSTAEPTGFPATDFSAGAQNHAGIVSLLFIQYRYGPILSQNWTNSSKICENFIPNVEIPPPQPTLHEQHLFYC